MLDEYQRDEALLHFQRGVVLERAHRVDEAVQEYRRAIARYPYLREARDALGFYYQRYGLFAKAADEFRLVANFEDDFLAHFNLGYALLEIEQHEEALDAFHRCLDLIPTDPATHYEVAFLRYLKGDYLDALTHVQIALQYYTDDWEIYKLRGCCMIALNRFDEAHTAFQAGLKHAMRTSARAEMELLLASVARHRECEGKQGLKTQLYARHGVMQLGSAQDDGLKLREAEEYHFTYPDIATTLRRFLHVTQACDRKFTCVVALDRLAQPVARALATMLQLEQRHANSIEPSERPLLVMAIGREPEMLAVARERIGGQAVSFCLGLNWLRRSQALPDATGVMVRGTCSVPWEPELRRLRALGAPAQQIERCLNHAAEQIIAATTELGDDSMLEQQTAFYAHEHRLLRF